MGDHLVIDKHQHAALKRSFASHQTLSKLRVEACCGDSDGFGNAANVWHRKPGAAATSDVPQLGFKLNCDVHSGFLSFGFMQ